VKPVEIVVDGTDGAGKTPLVEYIASRLIGLGYTVATYAPFREIEVYPLWETDPIKASRIIAEVMQRFRANHSNTEIVIWDRAWPTVFVSTNCKEAREMFCRFPDLTVLLINTEQTILEKITKHRLHSAWVIDPYARKKYIEAYRILAGTHRDDLLAFNADLNRRFNLEHIFCTIALRYGW